MSLELAIEIAPSTESDFFDYDRRVSEAAKTALLSTGYRTLAGLGCDVTRGVVTLSGVVSSYYLKQVAQEAVLRLSIVSRIENAIQVQRW